MQSVEPLPLSAHLSEIRRKLAARLPLHSPDYFREQVPELLDLDATDDMITSCASLMTIIEQKKSCSGCQGYMHCSRSDELKGMWYKLAIDPREDRAYLDTIIDHCPPYKDYMKELQMKKLQEFSGKASTDEEFTFVNYPEEQRRNHPETYQTALDFANTFVPPKEGEAIPQNYRKGLYLFGDPGVSKTHLLLAVCNRLEERRVPVLFIRTESIFDKLRGMLEKKLDIEPILEQYCQVPVLIVDELAQETPPSEFTIGKVFRIINTRFTEGLPTFFTSNYAPNAVYKNVPARIQDAVAEKVEAIRSRLLKMNKHSHIRGRDGRKIGIDFLDGPKGGK